MGTPGVVLLPGLITLLSILQGVNSQLFSSRNPVVYDPSLVDSSCEHGRWKLDFTLKLFERNLLQFFVPSLDVYVDNKKTCYINIDPYSCGQEYPIHENDGCNCLSYKDHIFQLHVTQLARPEMSNQTVKVCLPMRYSWFRFSKFWCADVGVIPDLSHAEDSNNATSPPPTTPGAPNAPTTTTGKPETTTVASLFKNCSYGGVEVCLNGYDGPNCDIDARQRDMINATVEGYVTRMCTLLESGSDVFVEDKFGNPPIHTAAKLGNIDLLKMLLDYNNTLTELKGYRDYTPLIVAAKSSKLDAVNYLVDNGANVNATGKDKETALEYVVKSPNASATILNLLDKGANPEFKSQYGNPALISAVTRKQLESIKTLLNYNPNLIDITDEGGMTALRRAKQMINNDAVIQYLTNFKKTK